MTHKENECWEHIGKRKVLQDTQKSMWPLGQWDPILNFYYEPPMSTNSKQSLCILIFPYYINKNVSGQVMQVWKPVSV